MTVSFQFQIIGEISKSVEINFHKMARCNKLHPLVPTSKKQLITEKIGYMHGFVCDKCFKRKKLRTQASIVHHCSKCEYDLCDACYFNTHRCYMTKTDFLSNQRQFRLIQMRESLQS